MSNGLWVHFGCGLCAPKEWLNFDSSPTLRLQQLPMVGRFVPAGPYGRFPPNVRYGDVVKGLPLPNAAADLLYSSHVLEHLSLDDLRTALRNCRRALRQGGTFRLVLPDLELIVERYRADGTPGAAVRFMQDTLLGRESRSRRLSGFFRDWLGNSLHLWMWDYRSLAAELQEAGFSKVRRAAFNDSPLQAFGLVETADRWRDALGIECT
jgi:SAM-dependent methyltransferase